MLKHSLAISPTRRYVAQCYKSNFDGYYFRSFTLPDTWDNNATWALYYYMNELDFVGCVEVVFPLEDYSDIKEKEVF